MYKIKIQIVLLILLTTFASCEQTKPMLEVQENDHIVIIGNNLASRMMNYGHFETNVYLKFPDRNLIIRNMARGGNTPGFRPHAGRNTPWAFEGANKFKNELAKDSNSEGFFKYPDEWLEDLRADILLAFFGFSESFNGEDGIDNFKAELEAFIKHTKKQQYNGHGSPQLVLITPTAYQDLSQEIDVPNGVEENKNLALYVEAMKMVGMANNVPVVDLFSASLTWYVTNKKLTIDGMQLNEAGYELLSNYLVDKLFGTNKNDAHKELVHNAVIEKNWMWHNDYKIPNGVHVFGRRYDPYGPDNYPFELKKIREMTAIRDSAIWDAVQGKIKNLKEADAKTSILPEVQSNYNPSDYGRGGEYLYGQDALDQIHVAKGYQIELFASEKDFPELANPVQISFDDAGRLWVAVMPSYPHYKPGDNKPNDKLIILEDTNHDGKADISKVWADNLHIPVGFELASDGIYLSQGTNLVLLKDTDGDDKADQKEIILSGFDTHDSHHLISAFCADPSGAIYMGEGVFLHTNVETPYGTVRGTNGGFYRYNTNRHQLERVVQVSIPNPWGIAFDQWGQDFFLETSNPSIRWMMPSSIKPQYGVFSPKSKDLAPDPHKVRPTSGLEFVSSRHFPDDVQGDILLGNAIGYLGVKQHQIEDDGTGYKTKHRQDLIWSDDKNFRPVDLEFAPDGSLYIVDWHNMLVGHMQHNARDPFRDHAHGRIYRLTYPRRPLLKPIDFTRLSIDETMEMLKHPEYRTRYRAKRALRSKNKNEVLELLKDWVNNLDKSDEQYEHYLLEALWVSWGLNNIDKALLSQLLNANDYKVRAAAVRAVRYNGHLLDNQLDLLQKAAKDTHGRVRLEAIVAASWLKKEDAQTILDIVSEKELDSWMLDTFLAVQHRINGKVLVEKEEIIYPDHLSDNLKEVYAKGKVIYEKEGFCGTCHQPDGKGLEASKFPPLARSEWVLGDVETLIKLTLKGLQGPIEVLGKTYPGQVPMTPFEGILSDEELAAVLTYVRNDFGNQASAVSPETVKSVREAIADKEGFYQSKELK